MPKIIISIFKHFFIGLYNVLTVIPKYFIIGLKVIFSKDKEKAKIEFKKQNTKKNYAMIALSLTIYLVCVFFVSRWSVQQLKIKYLSESIIKDTDNPDLIIAILPKGKEELRQVFSKKDKQL